MYFSFNIYDTQYFFLIFSGSMVWDSDAIIYRSVFAID